MQVETDIRLNQRNGTHVRCHTTSLVIADVVCSTGFAPVDVVTVVSMLHTLITPQGIDVLTPASSD